MTAIARPALLPLVPLYRLGLGLRELRLRSGLEPVRRLSWPVVSVGSLSAGGAGKTPMTIALARALSARGLRVDVLSRGYGRRGKAAARVDPDGTAEVFGDEPLVIAREAGVPVYVAALRYEAGLLAEQGTGKLRSSKGTGSSVKGTGFSPYITEIEPKRALAPEEFSSITSSEAPPSSSAFEEADAPVIHLLDDGFQHRQLHRDVNILLLDANDLSAERLLPAGNLREPAAALHRADIIAIPAKDDAASLESNLRFRGWLGPVWRVHRRMEAPAYKGRIAAFCGIARPEQFFAGLEASGLVLAARVAYPDHHRYTASDLDQVQASALAAGAEAIFTTEKDRARLGALSARLDECLPLRTATLRVEIENQATAMEWLEHKIKARK